MRTAYLVKFRSEPAADTLDAIRWLAHPGPRRPAHLTIRGPFRADSDPITDGDLASMVDVVSGSPIRLHGVGRFRARRRATVLLHADGGPVSALGQSPDGRDYVPHVTIYSGPDVALARDLAAALGAMKVAVVVAESVVRVIVGRIDDPLGSEVLRRGAVAHCLGEGGFDVDSLGSLDRALRLRAIATLVGRLAE